MTRAPWDPDPDAAPRYLTLGETLLGLEHFDVFWVHATEVRHFYAPERACDEILLLAANAPVPKALRLGVQLWQRELKAIAAVTSRVRHEPWRTAPPPPPTLEEAERSQRELRVLLWLDELAEGRESA